jgi:BlaI family transcriptional regulator, penicillinase repressor
MFVSERSSSISDSEREVLKVLWEHGPSTARRVNELLRGKRRWAYTTVLTLLCRLEAKGYVSTDRTGAAHIFQAAVSQQDVVRRRLAELAADFCEGDATPLVLALVKGARFSSDEIDQFRRLIDQLEAKKRRSNTR